MKNYLIKIQYDGTRYNGWQVQKSTKDTIQGKIEHVLSTLCNAPVEVIGSGRTDAGVHARGQCANFHIDEKYTKEEIFTWLNKHLPSDIAVTSIEEVKPRFHCRYNAISKTYVYTIHTGIVPDVFRHRYMYEYDGKLDTAKMQEAAKHLEGTHDFKSFCGNKKMKKSTVRTVYSIDVQKQSDNIVITYTGDGFLQNMIRIITGTLIEIGDGRRQPGSIEKILESKNRENAGYTAPACGLTLEKVEYGKMDGNGQEG